MSLERVSKSLARDPFVRALHMKAWPQADGSMIITGGSSPHTLFAFRNGWKCDCTAAEFGAFCAHIAAVNQQPHKQGEAMAFTLDRPTGSDRGTPVPLPREQKMLYAGLFSSWFLHEGEFGTSVGIKCLVTHVAAGKSWEKLDRITEAMAFVNPKLSYIESKNKASFLVLFLSALTGSHPKEVVAWSDGDALKALNSGIGTGILFAASVEANKKGDKRNAIDKESFSEADAAFAPLASAMSAKIEIKQNKDDNSYIASPQPVYLEAPTGQVDDIRESLESEVPF
jgi:hypothetical protein